MSTKTTTSQAGTVNMKLAFDTTFHNQYKYGAYLPVYDETTTFPPIGPSEFHDRGLVANRDKINLLPKDSTEIKPSNITPAVGTEIRGLQLSQLDNKQKDELALLVAERGVVVFRDQDFKDIGIEKQKEFGKYFGPLHIHPVGAHVKDHLELHNIYLGPDNEYRNRSKLDKLTTIGYHSDVSYEHQPPGITILTLLSVPPSGGDTAWVSQVIAYQRLSTPIKTLLEGLRAEHSGFPQAENAARDECIQYVATTLKAHIPRAAFNKILQATGQKALFVQKGFTKRIIGLKQEESDALLKLLFNHISNGQDFQARVKWEEGTVALWDNRVTAHTAISDYNVHNPQEGIRHGFRITTLAERPIGVNGLESQWS